jgi:hypothetical protein
MLESAASQDWGPAGPAEGSFLKNSHLEFHMHMIINKLGSQMNSILLT